jgi:hypothetical protein
MIDRRSAITALAGLGGLTGIGAFARYCVLAPPSSAQHGSTDILATRIFEAVPEKARAATCLPFDHPLRQYYNRGVRIGGLDVSAASLGWEARCALTDLVYSALSSAGRARLPHQDAMRWAGVNFTQLLFFGDPRTGPYQALLSGLHLNLRLGGRGAGQVAFGGPQIYGDQRGNNQVGLPGNPYRYQMLLAHRLWDELTSAERVAVRVGRAPAQTDIGLQGPGGRISGLPVAQLAPRKRRLAHEIVDGILGTYADSAVAWEYIEQSGGIDVLHFADYEVDFEGGRHAGTGPSQIFRFEGPAAVLHFRGEPHVHAFIHVARDAGSQLSLGERLGENPAVLEGQELQRLFEMAMREHGQADVGLYPGAGVVGRLRAGTVRTGDVWVAESWVDDLVVGELRGADLAPASKAALRARGVTAQASALYRIATTGAVARERAQELVGTGFVPRSQGLLRDAIAAYLRAHGFPRRG